ncbi:polysaccharide pyruvyl transferase family protein [Microlunatus parietis]|uniref:polysaccharide pyruvyl transferase family protein n=1 Tax=Microlunatus parietis TaxID=682979 RepID=UPI0015CA4E4B|nr:polysaccharide pyruvyl transferase family protein [Microlunatus parietis]
MVVSGWQTVNIGDVAHSPGVLEAFRRFAPGVRLTLWARNIDDGVRQLLARYYPEVALVEERVGDDGSITPALERLFGEADLLVHGSGPSLVGKIETAAWRAHTHKPYGFFGVTVDPLRPYDGTLERSAAMIDAIAGDLLGPLDRELLTDAAFVYCRDSLTRRFLQGQGIGVAELEFGADGTVIFDVVDDDHGAPVLAEYGLVEGQFLCAVPRLRYTPYYKIRGFAPRAEDWRKEAYNAGYAESDLDVLRQSIISWVRATDLPALIVPEMSYAVELAETRLAGTFPADVRDRVHVLPRFWDLAEAAAVYRRAAAVVSMECHSPLIALAEGVPSLYLRQPTDTIKGQMYHDLGLSESIIELTDAAAGEAVERVAKIASDLPAARDAMARSRIAAYEGLRHHVEFAVGRVTALRQAQGTEGQAQGTEGQAQGTEGQARGTGAAGERGADAP